jgi:hypothetical protein
MGVKRTILAAVAVLAAGGVSAVAPVAANAGTSQCGLGCIGVFSNELGTYAQPNFVEHVWGGVATVGTPTGLTQASGADSSEDFINPHPGFVSDYYNLGLVTADVNAHYGSLRASQLEFAPLGVPSGLCVGVAADPYQNEPLSLQSCTVPGRTVWIIGTSLSPATAAHGFFPIVSGATSDFSHPFTMSYPRHVDTSETLPPIRLRHLKFLGADKSVPAQQLWGVKFGPLP